MTDSEALEFLLEIWQAKDDYGYNGADAVDDIWYVLSETGRL